MISLIVGIIVGLLVVIKTPPKYKQPIRTEYRYNIYENKHEVIAVDEK